jgi:hypothetical protein
LIVAGLITDFLAFWHRRKLRTDLASFVQSLEPLNE